jgi:hypothetical protein
MSLIQKVRARVAAVTIAATTGSTVGEADQAGRVVGVTYTPDASVTGAASPNSRTLTLVNKGQDGSGPTNIATLALVGSVNLTAFDEAAITLNGTAANLKVAASDILEWVSTAVTSGGGLVDPGGLVEVEIGSGSYTDVASTVGTIAQTEG